MNLANTIGGMTQKQDEFTLTDPAEGRLRRVFMMEGMIDNDMDLTDFPFDIDDIQVNFTTLSRWSSNDESMKGKACPPRPFMRPPHDVW